MTHYLLLKFNSTASVDYCKSIVAQAFSELKHAIPDIRGADIYYNVIARDSNMDIMVQMDLKDEATLSEYLNHKLHKELIEKIHDKIDIRVTFDTNAHE